METAARTGDQLTESFRQSRDTLIGSLESHPFVVGGIGFLIGAVIASALPVTQAENRMLGDTSDDLKNRAHEFASEGVHVAKAAAQDVYEKSVSRTKERGLTSSVIRDTVKDLGNKVKDVVQQASGSPT